MKSQNLAAGVLLLAASFCAGAQSMKPGLWEISSIVQADGGTMAQEMAQMQKELADMPPEQRKMMQDMMAKQGVSIGTGGVAAGTKVCMTKEMAQRNEISSGKEDCTHSTSPRSGNTMKFSIKCTNPPSSGEGQVTFVSPESYSVRVSMSTTEQGNVQKVNMDSAGKWLAADCGALKPAGMAR